MLTRRRAHEVLAAQEAEQTGALGALRGDFLSRRRVLASKFLIHAVSRYEPNVP